MLARNWPRQELSDATDDGRAVVLGHDASKSITTFAVLPNCGTDPLHITAGIRQVRASVSSGDVNMTCLSRMHTCTRAAAWKATGGLDMGLAANAMQAATATALSAAGQAAVAARASRYDGTGRSSSGGGGETAPAPSAPDASSSADDGSGGSGGSSSRGGDSTAIPDDRNGATASAPATVTAAQDALARATDASGRALGHADGYNLAAAGQSDGTCIHVQTLSR